MTTWLLSRRTTLKAIGESSKHLIPFIAQIASLVFFSLVISWGLGRAILYWFIILPAVVYSTSKMVYKNKLNYYHLLGNFIAFYAFMVFMIYKHYQSDLFQIMMTSMYWNLFIFGLYYFYKMIDCRGRLMG